MEDFCNAIHKDIVKQFRTGESALCHQSSANMSSNSLGYFSQAFARAESGIRVRSYLLRRVLG